MKRLLVLMLLSMIGWIALPAMATDNCANLPSATVLSSNGFTTPIMGWSSWYPSGRSAPTEAQVKTASDLLVSTGLQAAGYTYVEMDEVNWTRTGVGSTLVAPSATFPDGIDGTISYIHGNGQKAILYTSPHTSTCNGNVGSGTFESTDANSFASWGADGLKYDGCSVDTLYASCYPTSGPQIWQMMAQDIRATGRPMVMIVGYVPGAWGTPWTWAKNVGWNDWRTLIQTDVRGVWNTFGQTFDLAAANYPYEQIGFWSDCDYMEGKAAFTATQAQTQFGLCSLWGSTLMLGMDLSILSAGDIAMYSNSEVIAIDQDSAGKMAYRYSSVSCGSSICEVWVKPLHDGTYAMGLLNRDASSHTVSVNFSNFGGTAAVRDLWAKSNLGSMTSYSPTVAGSGLALIKVTPSSSGSTTMNNLTLRKITVH